MATTYTLIASNTVGSGGSSSIAFTSIVQTYTDLKFVWSSRSSADNFDMSITYNGSSANVSSRTLIKNTAGNVVTTSDAYASYYMNQSTATSNTFSNGELYMPNYTGSNNKSFSVDVVTENNDADLTRMLLEASVNANTAAITSITITPNAGSFVQYSSFYLYGISNA
jgi:hypothetical protein